MPSFGLGNPDKKRGNRVRRWIFLGGIILSQFHSVKAQVYSHNREIVGMICFLDGEIIYDPDSVFTVQSLSKIEPKSLAYSRIIRPPASVQLFGSKGKKGVYLMYTKNEAEAKKKNDQILFRYNKHFSEDKLLTYFPGNSRDSVLDIFHPRPGDIFPEFPGGRAALSEFISKNIQYPKLALENQIRGKIVLGMIINPDGTLGEMKPIAGYDLGGGLVEEALRVGQKIPRFFPGSRNHIPIKTFYAFPIQFLIDSRKAQEEVE